jgi:hypothetical protein
MPLILLVLARLIYNYSDQVREVALYRSYLEKASSIIVISTANIKVIEHLLRSSASFVHNYYTGELLTYKVVPSV